MLTQINDFIWGAPLMILILAGGLYLTVRLRLLQLFRLPLALKWMVKNEDTGSGDVSSFGALCTALSATIGTGNIVGVATAICAGGPGALFWMLVAAFFGMATKYSEGFLAVKYRVSKNGHMLGGPFYYIENGMGKKWKPLAKAFAFFGMCAGLLGIGTFTQVNGISTAVQGFFDPDKSRVINLPLLGERPVFTVAVSVLLAAAVAMVLLGGIKRISSVASIVVPFMAAAYIIFAVLLLCCNIRAIPAAFAEIFKGAFNPAAVAGGAAGTMLTAVQKGVARGIFSNEAGLGSAPIAAAAAQTNDPVRQGLVTMTGTFIDTIVICTMTGLSIIITGAWKQTGLEGVGVTSYAFGEGIPFLPERVTSFILMLCLVFFAFTTILGWNYYSEKCLEYLSGGKQRAVLILRILYILAVFIGPFMTVSAVWTVADIFNGLMALPNMIALFALSPVTARETVKYFKKSR